MRTAAVAAALFILSAAPALADHWFATNVRGTVLILVDDKWQDIAAGQVLPATVVVRTLENGHLSLSSTGIGIGLGGDAAVQILELGNGVALTHYAGTLDIKAQASTQVTVETPNGKVAFSAGTVRTIIGHDKTRVVVVAGKAQIADATGEAVSVTAGQAADVAMAGTTLEEPAAPAELPADPPAEGEPPAEPANPSTETPPAADPPDPSSGDVDPSSPGGGGGPSSGERGGPPSNGESASDHANGRRNGN